MIKRYVLHIEAHRNVFRYRPRISFKRAPRHGDRVVDGGILGTLKLCPLCQEGFLHEPDPRPSWARPKAKVRTRPSLLSMVLADLIRNASRPDPYPTRPRRSYHTPRPAFDYNAPEHVDLKLTDDKRKPKTKAEHVELKVDGDTPIPKRVEPKLEKEKPESTVVKLEVEEENPEELELGYELGTVDHKRGDTLWTHKAEYVVDKLENDILYLVRKDVWDERKKKAKHVELKDDSEKPGIVQLKFD